VNVKRLKPPPSRRPPVPAETLVSEAVRLLHETKGENIVGLDLRELGAVADYFVIASGTSEQHVRALARSLEKGLVAKGAKLWQREGEATRRWILLDYVDVVIHIFHHETREFYRLENLWGDAKRLDIPHRASHADDS